MQNNMHIHFTIHIAFNKIDTSIKLFFPISYKDIRFITLGF